MEIFNVQYKPAIYLLMNRGSFYEKELKYYYRTINKSQVWLRNKYKENSFTMRDIEKSKYVCFIFILMA